MMFARVRSNLRNRVVVGLAVAALLLGVLASTPLYQGVDSGSTHAIAETSNGNGGG